MAAPRYTFTVFTATYNRGHTLHRVYESLKAQTFRDFEWLVVDDGSNDGTGDLVRQWQCKAGFLIRYIWQENGGKHIAVNRGVEEAEGQLFLILDSDDACVPAALERFKYHWDSVATEQKNEFSGITCLTQDPHGNIVGTRFPFDATDSTSLEIRLKYGVTGEKWGFHRTEVMRQFPYPEIEGEKFIAESVVWNRIALRCKTRYVNEALRTVFPTPDSLSTSRYKIMNPKGARYCYRKFVNLDYPIPRRLLLRNYANYVRFSCHASVGLGRQIKDIRSPTYWLAAFPVGYLIHLWDKQLIRARAPSA